MIVSEGSSSYKVGFGMGINGIVSFEYGGYDPADVHRGHVDGTAERERRLQATATPTMNKLRKRFVEEVGNNDGFTMIAVAVEMPTGNVETIVNYHGVPDKIKWYTDKYDGTFHMKSNPKIRIVGFMLV